MEQTVRDNWHGYELERFCFEDREAVIALPKTRQNHGKWLLKTEYWDAFPDVELKLLEQGFHVAWVKNATRFATREDCDVKARFVTFIAEHYSLECSCIPIGMSCGGAHAVRFAGFYPELVSCLYIDAPVLNYIDFPGRYGAFESIWEREFVVAYPGITRSGLFDFKEHPMNMAETLIAHAIPILLVYGGEDQTIPFALHGKLFQEAYTEHPELLTVMPVALRGHHPHGLTNGNAPIVKFILENS